MMKPLSDKATLLALLIHEATTRDEAGRITHYWIPGNRWEGRRVKATEDVIIIGGGGDVRLLASLQARGLIAQTPRMREVSRYSFYSTEEVDRLIEERWAWIAERKAHNERAAAARLAAEEETL
jgi:hypothetical protein